MAESWRDLRPGDRVVLVATRWPGKGEPTALHGAHGTLLDLTRPHGYARVRWDNLPETMRMSHDPGVWLVHPESLVRE